MAPKKPNTLAKQPFKNLNVVYTEELNRDEGYWSSTSSSSSEGSSRESFARKDGGPSSRRPTQLADFRTDTKEKARLEWLWATGQLGTEPAANTKQLSSDRCDSKAMVKAQSSSMTIKGTTVQENVSEIPQAESPDRSFPLPSPAQEVSSSDKGTRYDVVRKELHSPGPVQLTTQTATQGTDDINKSNQIEGTQRPEFHSLAFLEHEEFESAQQAWIASHFERPFNAENEKNEAKKRAADRFYQQQRVMGSVSHLIEPDQDFTEGSSIPNVSETLLKRFANNTRSSEDDISRHRMFMACADALEKLVQSDRFVTKIQRFLKKHHRSLLSTRVMRENGEYCHADHAVFRAYVTEMEGCILRALHDGADKFLRGERKFRRGTSKNHANNSGGGYNMGGTDRITPSGISVITRIESGNESGDSDSGGVNEESCLPEFDEEEFFDFLFSSSSDSAEASAAGRGDVLSFEAWEALLSVLHFNSFIDLVDEFVAAEYGLDEMDTREDTKTAQKRGLPSSSTHSGRSPPPSPIEEHVEPSKTPQKQSAQPAFTTPSPPKGSTSGSTVGSGAAIRKLVPTNSSTNKAFVSSVTSGTVSSRSSSSTCARGSAQQRLARSTGDTQRAPGSAPQLGTSGTRSQSNTQKKN